MMVVRVVDGGQGEPLFQKAIGDSAICSVTQEAWPLIGSPETKKVKKGGIRVSTSHSQEPI